MRSYTVHWASYAEGVVVQASWSEEKGDFSNLAFMTWDELQTIANWRITLDQVPPPLVGEGYIAVPSADGRIAVYTTTASMDFAPNQFLTYLGPKTLPWLLDDQRPAATDPRPFGPLSPAVLEPQFVADARKRQARESASAMIATVSDSNGVRTVRLK